MGLGRAWNAINGGSPIIAKTRDGLWSGTKMLGNSLGKISKSAVGPHGPIQRYGNVALNLYGGFIKYTPEKMYFNKRKGELVTKPGRFSLSKTGLVAGSIIGLGVMAKDIQDERAGVSTGVTRATPSYLDNAGATGDLVFAMHQNRKG
ncbi:hypothetical protein [Lysinibacillus fusiformis]|uniref:hypothetical protein n=1 Tax=Lysinibacillus fusiformis TaxID=28031 RepID=UPI000469C702|nr:hypothetical protein [Lysinibacillus fusiformis]